MKTEEDEAFDDLAKRQGMWGGGFQAKRAAAADKLYHSTEARWCETFVEVKHPHIEGQIVRFYFTQPAQDWKTLPKKDAPLVEWAKEQTPPAAQPAQEPPKYAMSAYWEDDGRIGVVATVERPDGGYHLLGAIIDPPPVKEGNT